ncbi:MAG: hypothetical protein IPK17_39380 [Chloroflexi bacterium]|uniref:hypothetical protein n=1 Tax=Candidatus Flexifilum breve TaxID=3140694 RepID=UPI003135943E|nr:hypothetical protein [Chloroflexota bacterium]
MARRSTPLVKTIQLPSPTTGFGLGSMVQLQFIFQDKTVTDKLDPTRPRKAGRRARSG